MTAEPRAPLADQVGRLRGLLAPQPTIGAGAAARNVAEDASALIRAEIDLAKAELAQSAKAKAAGAGLLVGAGVMGWLALQGLLVTAALALALVLPVWAAALIVSGALLAVGGLLGMIGARKLSTPVDLATTKHNIQEDVEWTKSHLPKR